MSLNEKKPIKVEYKKLDPRAVAPDMANPGDAAFDLRAIAFEQGNGVIKVSTGLAFAIPDGYEGQIRSRSGLASNGVFVTNGVGTIDSGYRGEVKVLLSTVNGTPFLSNMNKTLKIGNAEINIGDRIAQLAIREVTFTEMSEVDSLDETVRGEGGFGSSGK